MIESVVVWIIVGFVVFLLGRKLRRVLTGNTCGCQCGGGGCRPADPGDQTGGSDAEP